MTVLGHDPARRPLELRRQIGIVLQSGGIYPHITPREALEYWAGLYPHPRSVAEVIELVDLGEQADTRTRRLSGGQLRRLDFAVALVGDPELIFLDEPTTGFDPEARRSAWQTIRSLRDLGKTIVLTTHYLEEAQELADRVAIVKDGRILADGHPRELGAGAPVTASPTEPPGASWWSSRPTTPQRCCTSSPAEALAAGGQLQELSVARPTLEDVYLELTSDE